MAARKKKAKADLAGNADPRSPLDGAALLSAAKPLLTELSADLLKRADESAPVTEALKARHAAEHAAERTAEAYPEWRRTFVEQVAAAWLLSCVFVRTLEDRGLLGKARIAGEGAEDSWKAFLQLAPSLSEREYLLSVFRELSRLPATGALFDARHNPVWLLGPSAEGARKLLDLFRSPSVEAPTFRFGGEDTRFLGDLYQDVSEGVRKQYALLQTPRFVEAFILDRTLDPALEKFGLDETNLIDPTCGSGHFLLGAFDRLYEARLRAAPGLTAREAATKALDAVAGADINPYAVAIARFRLTLAFVEKCGFKKLRDAPAVPVHVAVADSLLYNPQTGQQMGLVKGTDAASWESAFMSLEDPEAARDVMFKQYAAVVGNPPYITVKDPVLRERYRGLYPRSAAGKYSLATPFAERFFQLGRDGGFVGMITANSFMKREFGKRLIEEFFPSVDLSRIVNTAGTYIPGHTTPTVLIFGTAQPPVARDTLVVLAKRGEPRVPSDPERGHVWSSILRNGEAVGFDDEYISVAMVPRSTLAKHPWSLGGGGAAELKELLEARSSSTLRDLVDAVGPMAVPGEDDVFVAERAGLLLNRGARNEDVRAFCEGEHVRDWGCASVAALFPYDENGTFRESSSVNKSLWPFRTTLRGSVLRQERGKRWNEYGVLYRDKMRTPDAIAFAEVATHNHFAPAPRGTIFKQTAPVIKLKAAATEEDYLCLLGYLNSSTACFWMKQVCVVKGLNHSSEANSTPFLAVRAFNGTRLLELPLPLLSPSARSRLAGLARRLLELSQRRVACSFRTLSIDERIDEQVAVLARERARILCEMIGVQEELDWLVYELFGITSEVVLSAQSDRSLSFGQRAFERRLWKEGPDNPDFSWFRWHGIEVADTHGSDAAAKDLLGRIAASPELQLLETPECKRRWIQVSGKAGQHLNSDARVLREEGHEILEDLIEATLFSRGAPAQTTTARDATRRARSVPGICCLETWIEGVAVGECLTVLSDSAVPFLAAHRHTEEGLEKRRAWELVWARQAEEDMGREGSVPEAPPKYDQNDYGEGSVWRLRGKLDVPKERFISYPGCESDEDKEPVYGWAGWDHLQRAVALAGLYQDRKQREGWPKGRLLPILAGLLELLPWLHQWHNTPSADLGGERPSDQFQAFLDAECAEHGFTHDDLRAWRPLTAAERRKAKGKKTKAPSKASDDDAG